MHIEDFRSYCLQKMEVYETFPFDEHVLVFKVVKKMFAATNLNSERFEINLKCDPQYAQELREEYLDIQPGYHMNKKHWNTINCEGVLEDNFIYQLIDHSYERVVAGLKKEDRERLRAVSK